MASFFQLTEKKEITALISPKISSKMLILDKIALNGKNDFDFLDDFSGKNIIFYNRQNNGFQNHCRRKKLQERPQKLNKNGRFGLKFLLKECFLFWPILAEDFGSFFDDTVIKTF